ncbi:hypothetical protein A3767_01330 [Oleiphilus sp. HI0133]|nr:hypothetical protein A3767_01330 [Oleiphilus sp. HI0133]
MKISRQIKTEAKNLKKTSRQTEKLTRIQDELAVKYGYKNYKDLVNLEKNQERLNRFEREGVVPTRHSVPLFKLGNKLEVFLREDGQRGVRALKNFEPGDVLISEQPLFWTGIKPHQKDVRPGWLLTEHIASNFLEGFKHLVRNYQLRDDLFEPRFDDEDRLCLSELSNQLKIDPMELRKTYNIVSTYHCLSHIIMLNEDTKQATIGERTSILLGLCFINHSCRPNAIRKTFESLEEYKARREKLIALTSIKKGDEIGWSYADVVGKNVKARRKELQQLYGFRCFCKRCIEENRGR